MWYLIGMLLTILLFVHEFRRSGITLGNNKKAKFITPSNPLKPRYNFQKKGSDMVTWNHVTDKSLLHNMKELFLF
jgi:hypothetical protein